MSKVRIALDEEEPLVSVDGHNVAHLVQGLQFDAAGRSERRLVLDVNPMAVGELQADDVEVRFVLTEDTAGWLRSLDPEIVEAHALEGAGMGDPASAAELVMRTLIAMAEAADGETVPEWPDA